MLIVHSIGIVKFPHPDWLLKSSSRTSRSQFCARVFMMWNVLDVVVIFFYNSHRFAGRFWPHHSHRDTYFLGEKGILMARFLEKVKPTNGKSLPVNPFPSWVNLYFSRCTTGSGLSGSNSSKWDVSAAPSKFGTYGGTAETCTHRRRVVILNCTIYGEGRGRKMDNRMELGERSDL